MRRLGCQYPQQFTGRQFNRLALVKEISDKTRSAYHAKGRRIGITFQNSSLLHITLKAEG